MKEFSKLPEEIKEAIVAYGSKMYAAGSAPTTEGDDKHYGDAIEARDDLAKEILKHTGENRLIPVRGHELVTD
jgi:hypothetical protein